MIETFRLSSSSLMLMSIMELYIDSPKPHRMQNHVEHIIPLRREINLKMPPHSHSIPLHLHIPLLRYSHQNLLQVCNLLHLNLNGKLTPIQDVVERLGVVILEQQRNAAHVDRLHHPRARNLPPAGADAVLAPPEHAIVRHVLGEVLVNLNVGVPASPLLHQDLPDVAVDASRVEH